MSQVELRTEITRLLPPLQAKDGGAETVDSIIGILEGSLWTKLDYPHQPHHNLRVLRDSQCISASLKLKSWEKDFLEKGIIVHDTGRNFVDLGLIEEHEHQNGSFVLAKIISSLHWGFSEDIANYFSEGIALHVEDVLPKNVPKWVRVLRDSDRTSRLGMGGIIELAWYLGYRDAYINETPFEQIIEDELLFDLSIPLSPEDSITYDAKPKKYFIENILPFLMEHNKLQDLANGTKVLVDRIYGVSDSKKGKTNRWIIEPVSEIAQFLSKPRVASMNQLFNDIGLTPIELSHMVR